MMPEISVLGRRQRPSLPDDSEDDDGEGVATPTSQASSNKRARLSRGLEDDDNEEDEDEDEEASISLAYTQDFALSNGVSRSESRAESVDGKGEGDGEATGEEHPPGSIVRVKLTNFVTYTSAEFFPAPKLNMIIGPNGTGKSTLVCAICLGLGFPTHLLGRAKEISEFVKHGCAEAEIEIELAKDLTLSKRNVTVRRSMKREGNKSTFSINGKPANKNKVAELCRRLSVQVDNLCQFLPQEKVADFARMDPVTLLHQTQRAVCGSEMIEWHDNLKDLRKEQKRLGNEVKINQEVLDGHQRWVDRNQADVNRMHEREQLQGKVKLLERSRPLPKYREAQEKAKVCKERRNQANKECEELKRSVAPALRAVNAKQEYQKQVQLEVARRKKQVDSVERRVDAKRQEVKGFDDKKGELEHEYEQNRIKRTKLTQELKRIQYGIDSLKKQMENDPVEFDAAAYMEKIREQSRILQDMSAQGDVLNKSQTKLRTERTAKQERIKNAQQELKRLDSQAGRQEMKLRQSSKDSYHAWRWIQENKDKFEHEVFGPPMVTCSIKDPKYVHALEALFQRNDVHAFTVQSKRDFKTLHDKLSAEMKLHDTSIKMCSTPFADASRRPQGLESFDLAARGFDGWALDYISGPEPVLAMLCSDHRIHMTPVRLRDVSNQEFDSLVSSGLGTWVAGRNAYTVRRRREYGPSAQTTQVKPVQAARVWTDQPIDIAAKRDLQDNIQGWSGEVEAMGQQIEEAKASFDALKPKFAETRAEEKRLRDEKNDKQTALTRYRALPVRLAAEETKLETHQQDLERNKEAVKEIVWKVAENALNKAKAALAYSTAVENLRIDYEQYLQSEIRLIEATSDAETLTLENTEINQRLKAVQREASDAAKESEAAHTFAKTLYKDVQALSVAADADEDFQAILQEISKHTSEQLEADIESAKASLELIHSAQHGNIIQEFESRLEKIEKLTDVIRTATAELAEIAHAINDIRGRWEPKLEGLAAKISDGFATNMASIGCAGQVSIYKADDEDDENSDGTSDFEKWGVHIRVKFREHESLQLLTAHRQSGGERSVSTIFYLMALQSLSASPFRVVDEINQGMDPRNERKVHERMVDIACSAGGSQYFLITPKLLTGLKYRRGMAVHCIVSGEFVPDERDLVEQGKGGSLDFARCVDVMRGLRGLGRTGIVV